MVILLARTFGFVPVRQEKIIAELQSRSGPRGRKIRTVAELAVELGRRRSRGETIVFTNGCFDILHAGHVRFLEDCRAFGDVLVVGLNSDASARAQGKSPNRPVIPQDQRAAILAALEVVGYVVIFDELTPQGLIERLSPDVLIKGQDWADRGVVGREHVEATGGRVVLLPLLEGVSTTRIIERIRSGS